MKRRRSISGIENKWLRRAVVIVYAPFSYVIIGALCAVFFSLFLAIHLVCAFPAAVAEVGGVTATRRPFWMFIRNAWRGGDA